MHIEVPLDLFFSLFSVTFPPNRRYKGGSWWEQPSATQIYVRAYIYRDIKNPKRVKKWGHFKCETFNGVILNAKLVKTNSQNVQMPEKYVFVIIRDGGANGFCQGRPSPFDL